MFELRPYQREAVCKILEDLKTHKKIGVVLSTGSGKTEIFIETCDRWLTENPGKSVLVLSHLSLLTTQTAERFELRAPHRKVGVLQADEYPDPDCEIIVSTMQSSRVEDKTDLFKSDSDREVGLVIVDEAHYLTTDSYESALSSFPQARLIGVTATPFRSRQLMLNYFEKISYSLSLNELIRDGYLVPPKLKQITARPGNADSTIGLVTSLYDSFERGKKAVVFMQTIEDADACRNAFVNMGIRADSITSELTGTNRDEILEDFRSGDTMVLTTVNVLSAGFDAPCLEAIFMPYATSSPTLYMQRIGRGLRPYPGKENCRVYVVGDAPSIARGAYEKIHKAVLSGKIEDGFIETDTLASDLSLNSDDSKHYNWTARMLEIAREMYRWGATQTGTMLNEKRFPERYLNNIETIFGNLKINKPLLSRKLLTDKQRGLLTSWGFPSDRVAKMDKGEASAIISAIIGETRGEWRSPWILRTGKYEGKHVAALPWTYRRLVMNKFPDSEVAKQIREWDAEQRKRGIRA